MDELMVFQAPTWNGKERRWGLGDEAFEDEVGAKAFKEVDDEVDVLVGREEVEISRMGLIFFGHACASDELKLVEFEHGEREGGKDFGFVEDVSPALPRKSENEVGTHGDASVGCSEDGINRLSVGVATIDTRQRRVIDGLDAVLDEKEGAAIQFFEIIQERIGHAVGPSADDEAKNIGHREGLLVFGFEVLERIVGVGVGLKISQILHFRVLLGKESFAFLQLLRDGFGGSTIAGIEGLVVAIGAASRADSAVAVGTGETSIERDFLSLNAQLGSEPCAVVVIHH